MSERDELAAIINMVLPTCDIAEYEDAQKAAEDVLAAGWSRPRVVTSVEELDALPEGSMILDADPDTLLKVDNYWRSVKDPAEPYKSSAVIFPATVLFEGAA